jgi:ADP-ribose pyrophosphatase YjhB (NUDIX family)
MVHAHIEKRIILSGCLIINEKKEILLLYRSDHNHYETPGGKVRLRECSNPENPSNEDLAKTAERELYEELGENIKIKKLKYFGKVEFEIPGGKLAVANKFLTSIISGNPILNEPDEFSKFDYLPIEHLEKYPISPDLKLILPRLKKYFEEKK